MKKVLFLIGLPGSGKTHYIQNHLAADQYKVIVDDPMNKTDFIGDFQRGASMVIADPNLCNPHIRAKAFEMFCDWEIEAIYFENAPEKCRANIKRRAAQGDTRKIGDLAAYQYQIPVGAKVVFVFG